MNRKQFLRQSTLLGASAMLLPSAIGQEPVKENPLFESEEIYEFVLAAHKDFDGFKRIVDAKPKILNCVNQIKKGDFETALGGAAHMGRKDIADLLVARGARWDMFSLTFLGYTDFVKQMIELSPHYLKAPGPHGFTLLHHAKVGKHMEFAKWLQDQGLETEFIKGAFG